MTKLERYKQKLTQLEAKRNQYLRSCNLIYAQRLEEDLKELRKLIAEAEAYEAKPVRQLMTDEQIHNSGLIPAIIEAHLATDYLAACCYTIQDIVNNMGFNAVSVIPDVKDIIHRANKFASFLMQCGNGNLSDLLVEDETMLEALHKKVMTYITRKLGNKPKQKKAATSKK